MTKKIGTTLLSLAALMQVACGGKSKKDYVAAFTQQCNTQACIDMYTNAAKNAGVVGPAAAAALPQVAAVGAPTLPGQVTNTSILPASVSDKDVAAQQAKIVSQLQAIVASDAAPVSKPAANNMSVASVGGGSSAGGGSAAASVGVTRLPASDIAAATSPAVLPQLTSSTGVYQPASVDNGSTFAGEPEVVGSGAGR